MKLSRGALRCLRQLEFYAKRTGQAFVFQRTLAKELGCTERTVKRHYAELVAVGVIQVQRRGHQSCLVTIVTSGIQRGQNVTSDVTSERKNVTSIPYEIIFNPRNGRKPPQKQLSLEEQIAVNNERVYQRLYGAHA